MQLPAAPVVAFQELKLKCITAPMLAFADFHRPFLLEKDASGDGLGTVLSQKQENGCYHPVAYASRGLNGGELRYHSSKLEFLALKWAITEQFCEYLQYQPFGIKTDNNPLTYVMPTPNLDAVGHCWVASLPGFNFTIKYLRGADKKVADTLSRVGDRLELDTDSVHKLLSHSNDPTVLRAKTDDPRLMQEHARQEQEIIMLARMLEDSCVALSNLADSHWIIAQQSEPVIQLTTQWLKRLKDDHSTLAEFLQGKVPDQI